MNRTRMILTLTMLFTVSLFLIGLGDWLWAITTIISKFEMGKLLIIDIRKPYGALGLVLVVCGALVLASASGLLFDWYKLMTHKRLSPHKGGKL